MLCADILDLAKFEAGKLDLHEVHFDIRACVEACIDVVSIAAERRGIEVVSDIAEEVPATMLGDFDRVRQVNTHPFFLLCPLSICCLSFNLTCLL